MHLGYKWSSYLQLCFQAQPSDKGVSDMVTPLKAQSTPLLGDRNKLIVSLIQFNMTMCHYISSTIYIYPPKRLVKITRNWPAGACTILGQVLVSNRRVYN